MINVQDHPGNTPLHIACENWPVSEGCVSLLVERGADVNQCNNDNSNPLHLLAHRLTDSNLDEAVLDAIIKASHGRRNLLTSKNVHQTTPLFIAWQRMVDAPESAPLDVVFKFFLSRSPVSAMLSVGPHNMGVLEEALMHPEDYSGHIEAMVKRVPPQERPDFLCREDEPEDYGMSGLDPAEVQLWFVPQSSSN